MPHLELEPKRNLSTGRRLALGTWRTAYDPSVYGTIEVTMDQALRYIQEFRVATGRRLTVTHLVTRAVAEVLRLTPDANALLRWNRIYLRKRIGIFLHVAMAEPRDDGSEHIDLSGIILHDVADKTLVEIVDEVARKADAVRRRQDPELEKSRVFFSRIPYLVIGLVTRLAAFLLYTLNIDLGYFGMPRDPFGSVMITNIGSLGLDTAYVPLVGYSRVPILLATGAVKERVVVEQGQPVVRHCMNINATFDHRFIDGYHAAAMSKILRDWLEHPYERFGPIPGPSALPEAASEAGPNAA